MERGGTGRQYRKNISCKTQQDRERTGGSWQGFYDGLIDESRSLDYPDEADKQSWRKGPAAI